jgi:hypothetical protein
MHHACQPPEFQQEEQISRLAIFYFVVMVKVLAISFPH